MREKLSIEATFSRTSFFTTYAKEKIKTFRTKLKIRARSNVITYSSRPVRTFATFPGKTRVKSEVIMRGPRGNVQIFNM